VSDNRPQPPLIQALGLRDVVMMTVVAVVGLRWIARGARAGPPSVVLWLLAWVMFFVPLAAVVAELSSRYPEQGGIYAWTRRAFGPAHAFLCGWCLWVNNLFYFPSLLLFASANVLAVFGGDYAALAENRTYAVVFVLGALWFCTAINIVGFGAAKWLQNVGSLGTWIPAALLIGAGAVAFATFGSATSFAPRELIPRGDVLGTISLWSAMCFAFSGFEITSLVGQEVKQPRRNIPLGVAIAGLAASAMYILGSASVLVAVPASALAERSGITDAVDLVASRVGLAGLGALTGALLSASAVAGTSSWFAGAGRVPFAAGVDNLLPPAFARLHHRYRTPHVVLIVQAVAASALFLTSVFLTVTGGRTTIQEAYDILVNLTILVYFVPYIYLFICYMRLREESHDAPMRIPGGPVVACLLTAAGLLATIVSIVLVFVPPSGTENLWNYEVNLIVQGAVLIGGGALFYRFGRRRPAPSPR
jgi:amino acid transporter